MIKIAITLTLIFLVGNLHSQTWKSIPKAQSFEVPMYTDLSLKPYELVNIVFLDNFAEECGINSGTSQVVPAFYLLMYKSGIDQDQFWDEVASAANSITIIAEGTAFMAAPFTFGGSLALLGTILSAADIMISENRENATTSEIELYKEWDSVS